MARWHSRMLEVAGAILLASLLMLCVVMLSGCASIQKERALLFAPEGLPSNAQIFERNYSEAIKAVDKGTSTSAEMVTYVDAGVALLAKRCHDWLDRLTLARRGVITDDHTMAIFGGLLMTLAGAFAWPADVITVLGASQVAAQGFSQSKQQDILGAPSAYAAQNHILAQQAACGDKLLADAPKLRFSQVYGRLEACARICSHDAASEAATRALMGAKP